MSTANKTPESPASVARPSLCAAPREVVVHCVFCRELLTRPGGKKWWIGRSRHDEGLCYDCILAGMRVIMAGVEYAQEHGQDIAEFSPNSELSDRRENPKA